MWAATVLVFGRLLEAQQSAPLTGDVPVHLLVKAGTPLRMYITKRVSYRKGEAVSAKLIEPVWAFDRVVLPEGASIKGEVTRLDPVPNMARAMAIMRGDFTPLKTAQVTFSKLVLANGQQLETGTEPTAGLLSIYIPPNPKQKAKHAAGNANTHSGQLRRLAQQQVQAQINARTVGFLDFVRGRNKREWLEDFFWSKLPYHPQRYRSGTRFDAVLNRALDFGMIQVPDASLKQVGRQQQADLAGIVQLTASVTSADARIGDPILGVLSRPLFSADHKLVLPEGTDVHGRITLARRARMFHRGGQLRFTFDEVRPPTFLASAEVPQVERTQAQLTATEQGAGPIAVDAEGTAKATESKTRFLNPIIAGLVAARSADNDAGKQNASGGGNANYSGRSLGGFSGFGLLGTAASQGPRPIGTALGYYGLAWSVYSNIISRGREVTFEKNSAIAIRFGGPAKKH